jgi:4,5-dihydroxyphthalate decarboxylase
MKGGEIVLSYGCLFSDRSEALLDGRVKVEGVSIVTELRQSQPLFADVLRQAKYDMAEMSLGSHIAAIGAGKRDYVGLPVFLSRSFRHSNIYIRTDRGIASPADLAGKRVGVIDYQQTATAWVRGMLADDYGVERESVVWITGGLQAPVLEDRMKMAPRPGLSITRTTSTLDALLASGEIDSVICPTAPQCFTQGHPHVARLFPDYRADEIAFHRRTGLFPLMHCVVLRRSLAEDHLALPCMLFEAFSKAKDLAYVDLGSRDYPKLSMPWLVYYRNDALTAIGGDIWTYGVEANRHDIATLLRYAAEDGLTDRQLTIEEVFAPVGN